MYALTSTCLLTSMYSLAFCIDRYAANACHVHRLPICAALRN